MSRFALTMMLLAGLAADAHAQGFFKDGFESAPPPPPLPSLPTASNMVLFPSQASLPRTGQVVFLAELRDGSGNLINNRVGFEDKVVTFQIDDPSIATVGTDGRVRAVAPGSTTLRASVDGLTRTAPIQVTTASAKRTTADVIAVSPSRLTLDLGASRVFSVTAGNSAGPVTLNCDSAVLNFDASVINATYNGALGTESISVTGLTLGRTIMEFFCDGLPSTPVVIEVTAPVVVPKPETAPTANFGIEPSVLITSSARHVSSYDQANRKLIYSAFSNSIGRWSSDVVSGTGSFGRASAMMLDPLRANAPTICALQDTQLVCYLRLSSGWITRPVQAIATSFTGYNGRVVGMLDGQGTISLIYFDQIRRALVLAKSSAATRDDWTFADILVSGETAIDFDAVRLPSGQFRVAVTYQGKLYYGQQSLVGWQFEEVTPSAGVTRVRLLVGRDNVPRIVYSQNGTVSESRKFLEPGLGRLWAPSTVHVVSPGTGVGYGLNRLLESRVSYQASGLTYAIEDTRQIDGQVSPWLIEKPIANSSLGAHSTLQMDEVYRASLAYYDSTRGNLGFYVEPVYPDFRPVDTARFQAPENIDVTVPATPAPTLQATAGAMSVTLSWNALPNSTYSLYWSNSANTGIASANRIALGAVTSFVHTGLAPNTDYFYRIQAQGVLGDSVASSEIVARPFNTPPTISAIQNIELGVGESAQISFQVDDGDTGATQLVVTATSSNQAVVANAGLVIAPSTSTNRTLTLLSTAPGAAEITVTVSDGIDSASTSFVTNVRVRETVQAIAAGLGHTCAVTTGGGGKCWGYNGSGRLGDGTTNTRLTAVDVSGLISGVSAFAAGHSHTCALTTGGGVKCWGLNVVGGLGDGSTTNRLTPVDVSGLTSGVSAITAGQAHTCALTTGGGVKCWGRNNEGQLGDGSTTQRLTAVDVSGLISGVSAIAAGHSNTCALTTGGGVKCWGSNSGGQLGDGTSTQRLTAVDVSGLTSGVSAITAVKAHTCALTTGGGVKCWGLNNDGQLGDGSTTQRLTAVDVSDLTNGVSAITAGQAHTCALTTGGRAKCWGDNSGGQLGDGSSIQRLTPVDVLLPLL